MPEDKKVNPANSGETISAHLAALKISRASQ
jgi:hypothetical protein